MDFLYTENFGAAEIAFYLHKEFDGGDVDENRAFIEGKVVAHYQNLMGAMLMKIVILLWEKWSHITKF